MVEPHDEIPFLTGSQDGRDDVKYEMGAWSKAQRAPEHKLRMKCIDWVPGTKRSVPQNMNGRNGWLGE